ncbi:MAG: hypothetical protein ABIJ96_15810 [Elusimicrobiota bacterium]
MTPSLRSHSKYVLIPFAVTILFIFTLSAFFGHLHNGWIFGTDAQYNYMIGRSLYFDHDLDFENEWAMTPSPNLAERPQRTKTGRIYNQTPIGYSLLAQPFFFTADMLTRTLNLCRNEPLPDDGYRGLYGLIVPLSSILFALLGLFFGYRILRIFFVPDIAALAINSLVLSSSLLWYITGHLTMTHAHSFAVVTLMIFLALPLYSEDIHTIGVYRFIGIGCVFSLAVMVRFQNVVFGLIAAAPVARHILARGVERDLLKKTSLAVLFAAICYVPQSLYMRTVFGHYLINTYADTGWSFSFSPLNLVKTLFSTNHGLLLWHPVILFSCVGSVLLMARVKTSRFLMLSLSACFLLTWFIVAFWDYTMANSFGNRGFNGLTVFVAMGWAEVLRRSWQPPARRKYALLVCALLVLWNLQLLMQQRYLGWLPFNGEVSYLQVFKNYKKLPPELARIKAKLWGG